MNWREIYEQRLERDPQYRYRIDRFKELRRQANAVGQQLAFDVLPTGILKISFVEKVEKKLFGFVYKTETNKYPVAESMPYTEEP